MAVWAIGDVQGCHAELLALLERLRFDPAHDQLWLVGDLVNRGPDSLATLRFVRGLGPRAVVTLGNHDLHLLAVAEGTGRKLKRRDTLAEVLAADDCDELLDWLRHRPLLHHDAALGWTMVHAGLPPEWDLATAQACAAEVEAALRGPGHAAFFQAMYGDEPARWRPDLSGKDRLRYTVNALTRLRFLHPDGRLDFAWKGERAGAPPGLVPWFAHPERRTRGLPMVFGHWSTLGPVTDAGAHALDTGCVWGGSLSALRLDVDPPIRVEVACRTYLAPGAD